MNRATLAVMFQNLWFKILVGLTPAALVTQFIGDRGPFEILVGVATILLVVGFTARTLLLDARIRLDREADALAREARVIEEIERWNASHPERPFHV